MSTDHDHSKAQAALKALAEKRQRWVDANVENAFDEGIKTLLTELYPENAHFIFELLQNAEDKHAQEVTFRLHSDKIVVEHNGPQLFSLDDIDAITSIGKSPKRHDTTKIGKFGVGFKSVFAYTDTPEVRSGPFHFRIRDLVVPDTDGFVHASSESITRFVFPFNNKNKPAADAAREVERGLIELADTTLLFLTHIHTLRYYLPNGTAGSIQRIPHDEGRIEIRTRSPNASDIGQSFWLRFDKTISVVDQEDANRTKQCPIAVAYKLEQRERSGKERTQTSKAGQSADWKIVPVESGQVSIYFPAVKEDSRLRFCLHAPFASTVARDSVRECRANDTLRDHLATLTADSLISIRDGGLLTIDFLGVLPLASDGLSGFYEPFLKAVLDAFQTRPLTPTLSGKHRRAAILRKGVNDVTSLLSDSDLASLTENRFLRWAANPRQRNQREDRFLTSLGIEEWTLKDLRAAATDRVFRLAVDWLKKKDNAWLSSLYSRLNKTPKISDPRLAAEAYPIVRLIGGAHVRVTVNGVPAAYLPTENPAATRFKIVSPAVLTEEDARGYFVSLGYSEPDLIAEVTDYVVPRYASGTHPSATENVAHLQMIVEAYATDSIAKRSRLDTLLKQTAIVRCKVVGSGQVCYATPGDAYFLNEDILTYFEGNPAAKIIETSYSEPSLTLLRRLGVDDLPRRCLVTTGDPPVREYSSRESRIENYELDGLEWLLSRHIDESDITLKARWATCLCRILTSLLDRTPDGFEARRHYFYYQPLLQVYDSLLLKRLKNASWMVTSDGRCLKPGEVSRDDLSEEMLRNDTLLTKLGVQPAAAQKNEEQQRMASVYASILGINLEQIEFVRQHQDEFEEWRRFLETRAANSRTIASAASKTSERRRQKLQERKDLAPPRKSVLKMRSVAAYSSAEIDPQSLFKFYRNEEDEKLFCQMCLDLMPFEKRDGEDYSECVTLLTKPWAESRNIELKVLTPLNLILCPTCSSVYKEYVHKDLDLQDALYEAVISECSGEVSIRCSSVNAHEPDRTVHFDPTHLDDIRVCLGSDNE